MTFVPRSRILPRALWRPALFFFAVSQFLLAFAPLLEGRQGPDARAHVEEAGTTLHHAHNDADCAACIARGLLASADPQSTEAPLFSSRPSIDIDSVSPAVESAWAGHTRSRAPPVLVA
jgi:hypothetical protein